MKRVLAAATLAVFSLAPVAGYACEYSDVKASAEPLEQLGLAPAPAASKVPGPALAKAPAPRALKQDPVKVKAPVPASDAKVVAANAS